MKDFATRPPAAKAAAAAPGQGPALVDNRAAAVAQRKLQETIASSPRQAAPRPNLTGLPDQLKAGVESLSGYALDDVRVHYNSARPAALQAHAYAQGTNIHIAPGQEQHLPHEAWHVVQQKQGRVRPTRQLKGRVAVNDEAGLEREADEMGRQAGQLEKHQPEPASGAGLFDSTSVIQRKIINPNTNEPYKPGKLGVLTLAKKGLTKEQQAFVQELHDDDKESYTVEEAATMALHHSPTPTSASVASTSSDATSAPLHSPPFPWRFGAGNQQLMNTMTQDKRGFVSKSNSLSSSTESSHHLTSLASHDGFASLPTTSKRAVQQTTIMGISPNVAAQALGLVCPTAKSWEWLHLVAFSISPTHLGDFPSAESVKLMNKTNQPQQISENLVLGTEAANTAMLTYETIIKRIMRANKAWQLRLYAAANVEWRNAGGVQVPVSKQISYHFFFIVDNHDVSPPIILTFDTLNHTKPTRLEYSQNVDLLNELITATAKVPNAPSKMIRPSMAPLTKGGKKALTNSLDAMDENDGGDDADFYLEHGTTISLGAVSYKVEDTGGGGDCMYSSALHLMGKGFGRAEVAGLREEVAKRLEGRISPAHVNGVRNGDDGDVRVDLVEVAKIVGCRFVVHAIGYSGGELQVETIGTEGAVFHMVHQGNHFMALKPQ